MTDDNDGKDSDPIGNKSQRVVKSNLKLNQLIQSMVKSVPFQTENVGEVQVRSMTMSMQTALLKRMKDSEHLTDGDVARIFIACTSTKLEEKDGQISSGYKPLSDEDAAQITDRDVERFAPFYFEKIVPTDIAGKDPVAVLAEHARAENAKAVEFSKKFAKEMSDLLKGSGVMANWTDLRKLLGPSAQLTDVMEGIQKSLSPLTDANRAIQDALNPLRGVDLGRIGIPPGYMPEEPRLTVEPMMFDHLLIDPEETPAGRAAAAAAAINEHAAQVAGDVAGMVKQVGTMTDLLAKVATHAEAQISSAKEHAKGAQRMAYTAIGVALFLPVVLWLVELPDRQLQGEREGKMVELLTEQNQSLSRALDQAETNRRVLREQLEDQKRRDEAAEARLEALKAKQAEEAKKTPRVAQ